jgi:hypothetical protein
VGLRPPRLELKPGRAASGTATGRGDQGSMSEPHDRAEPPSNTQKDPSEWTTGNEPMTGAQKSYLKTLSDEAKEPFDDRLTKAEASRRIDELQKKTGRGRDSAPGSQ